MWFYWFKFYQIYIKDSKIRVINIDKITYAGVKENLTNEDKDRYKLVVGDICDASLVNDLFKKYKFQSLIHFMQLKVMWIDQ